MLKPFSARNFWRVVEKRAGDPARVCGLDAADLAHGSHRSALSPPDSPAPRHKMRAQHFLDFLRENEVHESCARRRGVLRAAHDRDGCASPRASRGLPGSWVEPRPRPRRCPQGRTRARWSCSRGRRHRPSRNEGVALLRVRLCRCACRLSSTRSITFRRPFRRPSRRAMAAKVARDDGFLRRRDEDLVLESAHRPGPLEALRPLRWVRVPRVAQFTIAGPRPRRDREPACSRGARSHSAYSVATLSRDYGLERSPPTGRSRAPPWCW